MIQALFSNSVRPQQPRTKNSEITPEQLKQAALELAMAGQQGIDLKDPTPKHSLKAFPDAFSGMKIVSYMDAAFQHFMPSADVGIDLSKEYAAVKGGWRVLVEVRDHSLSAFNKASLASA